MYSLIFQELETSMPGWIDVRKFWFTPDGDRYITIRSVQHTDGFTYPHIVGAERRTEPKPITSGNRTVTIIIGFDAERDLM